jgi:hypothetical protein
MQDKKLMTMKKLEKYILITKRDNILHRVLATFKKNINKVE